MIVPADLRSAHLPTCSKERPIAATLTRERERAGWARGRSRPSPVGCLECLRSRTGSVGERGGGSRHGSGRVPAGASRSPARPARACTACRGDGRRGGERVDHRVLHRGRGPDRARLADALGAERVSGDGVSVLRRLEARELGRARHGVVGERGGERVAVVVVDGTAPTAPARCPGAMPPCCWPATSSGLRMRPQSSTAMWRTASTGRCRVDLDDRDVRAERERRAVLREVGDRPRRPPSSRRARRDARPTSTRGAGHTGDADAPRR